MNNRLVEAPRLTHEKPEIMITSSRDGRKALFESRGPGRSTMPHSLKGKFRQGFDGTQTVGGYIGSTNLVVEKVVTTPGLEPIVRAQFGGRIIRKNTKEGPKFEMLGGKTLYVSDGETIPLANEDVSITFDDTSKST